MSISIDSPSRVLDRLIPTISSTSCTSSTSAGTDEVGGGGADEISRSISAALTTGELGEGMICGGFSFGFLGLGVDVRKI